MKYINISHSPESRHASTRGQSINYAIKTLQIKKTIRGERNSQSTR